MMFSRNRVRAYLVVGAVLCALAVLLVAAASANAAGQPLIPAPPVNDVPMNLPHAQQGIPAIAPRPELASSTGARFTAADVIQWVSTHQLNNQVAGSPAAAVDSVEFMTAQQVSARLHNESTGVADDVLLCFVQVHGTFQTFPPPGIPGMIYHTGYLVFDAQTGNLLMSNV